MTTPQWGGRYASTTLTRVEVRCHRCGSFSSLTYSKRDGFTCRDTNVCAANRADALENQLLHYLEATRRS